MSERIGTHWENCGVEGGSKHYECLKLEVGRLKEARDIAGRAVVALTEAGVRCAEHATALGRVLQAARPHIKDETLLKRIDFVMDYPQERVNGDADA